MQAVSRTSTGTIREKFQDFFLFDADLRLAIVADGNGPNGLAAAETAARSVFNRIKEIAPVTGANENTYRLNEAIQQAAREMNGSDSSAGLSVVWANRSLLTMVSTGSNRIMLQNSPNEPWQQCTDNNSNVQVLTGQRILLCTEGLSSIINKEPLQATLNFPFPDNETFIEELTKQANALYDGDDRTILLLQTDPADLKAGEPKEIELFEHYNREFSFPVWAPLAAAGGISAALLLLAQRLHKHWRDFGK